MSKITFYKCKAVLLFAMLMIVLAACKNESSNRLSNLPPEELAQYITAYTSGTIGKDDAVVVQFSKAVVTDQEVGTTADPQFYAISPTIDAQAEWYNTNTLKIRAANKWNQDKSYVLSVRLAKVFPESDVKQDFKTNFAIRKTQLEVTVDGLYTPNEVEVAQQELLGSISANDAIAESNLKEIFSAHQDGRNLDVIITQNPNDKRSAQFRVVGVERQEEASELVFDWDAAKVADLGKAKGTRTISVSSINDFSLLSVEPKSDGGDFIELTFTDPIDKKQDLNGLIGISGVDGVRLTKDANRVRLYFSGELEGLQTVNVDASVRNKRGVSLETDSHWELSFTKPDPALRAVSDGAIMPHTGQRLFPFEAIGLDAVRVEVFKIFSNNVQQFLIDNKFDGRQYSYGLNRVGRIIHQERIMLRDLSTDAKSLDLWNNFAIDLSNFIAEDDKAIYQVRIGFGLEDARKSCDRTAADFGFSEAFGSNDKPQYVGFNKEPKSIIGGYDGLYGSDYEGYSWSDRDDVCKPAYYNEERFICRNILSSNLGLIVKQSNDKQTVVIATDLITGGPSQGAEITLYDEQQQMIKKGVADVDGRWMVETDQRPGFVSAKSGDDVAYIKLEQDNALTTSRFATTGNTVAGGVKGVFYAERGVWRPGDSIYLNFVLENQLLKLPTDYPISFTLTDPRGTVRERRTVDAAAGQIYALNLKTDVEDPTGNWLAKVEAGGRTYTKYLKVETIKPNRLKVNLSAVGGKRLTNDNRLLSIKSSWLHGAPAANLDAVVLGQLQENPNAYSDQWGDYVFTDPARRIYGNDEDVLFDNQLNAEGMSTFQLPEMGYELPGPMQIALTTRVFENGGDFSSDNIRLELVNFNALAGVSIPKSRWGSKRLAMNTNNQVPLVAIDENGKGLANRKLEVGLYKVNWRYWWQDENDNVSRFNSSSHEEAIASYTVKTGTDGRGTVNIEPENWGRYLVRVCDPISGHCSGDYFYAGSPRWTETDKDAAAMLPLRIEDKTYKVNETATITVESEQGGMILLSLETSAGVIETRWVEAIQGETNIPIKLDERMLPTVYASVMLIQPHVETKGNRPIRQYGILPIAVEDPKTVLKPTIATASEYKPEETFNITVAEENGQEMNYTLAVVDEGLLGLTRFATPDLWNEFFGKEALCVQTYDLYNQVIGSMDGQFNRILAIGGDGEISPDSDKAKANRFEPVVMHIGPFNLKAGKKAKHQFKMPNYIGAVRVMVVAEHKRKYGHADQSVPVRKDLMILPTLPRTIAPGESLELPVNVFAMTNKVKNVKLSVREENGLVVSKVANTKSVQFDAPGDQLVKFPFEVGAQTGVARFVVEASGNGESISQEIEVQIANPNAVETKLQHLTLAPGETKVVEYQTFGTKATRDIALEASHLPNLNLNKHINYLIRYPYGCGEQTTSAIFPQLHLSKLVELTPNRQKEVRSNVRAGLNKLHRFQTAGGGIAYWQGQSTANTWVSSYVLHMLLEAEATGYSLPVDMKQKLIDFQKERSSSWRKSSSGDYYANVEQSAYDQAYRLYTLALAGEANTGAMNRLRGLKKLNPATQSLLAAAYARIGRAAVAKELVNKGNQPVADYKELSYTFGSRLRDQAIMLTAYQQLGDANLSGKLALALAKEVSQRAYLSTQEGAFMITAMAKYLEGQQVSTGNSVQLRYAANDGKAVELATNRGLLTVELPDGDGRQLIEVSNNGQSQIYLSLNNAACPLPGEETATSKGLSLQVAYTDIDGSSIDVSNLKSGTDFIATYTINTGNVRYSTLKNLALQQIAASGWEISNERMSVIDANNEEEEDGDWRTSNGYDYKDYRDTRVNTFFGMGRGETKVFRLRMTAAYPGKYYLPMQQVEAMYDPEIKAAIKGRWVEVTN